MDELIRQLFQSYPFIKMVWSKLAIIVPFSLMFAYAGINFISVTAKIIGSASSRVIYAKGARQIARFELILGWSLLIAGRVWLYLNREIYISGSLENYLLEICWMLLSLGVFLVSIYYCLWGILKNMPVLHATLGILAGVQNCVTLACMMFTARIICGITAKLEAAENLPDLFPNVWNDPVWSAIAYSFPLIFATSGAFASCWVAIRKKKDDFGRDYYKILLPWSAAWARNGWAILLCLYIAAFGLQTYFNNASLDWIMETAIWALIWLIPFVMWIIFCRSKYPLRNAWLLFAALIFSLTFYPAFFQDIVQM